MLDLLRRILIALVLSVFVLPISVLVVVFAIVVLILGLILKLYDIIAKTDIYDVLVEFVFVCYGSVLFLIIIPYHILTDN